jgi:hypothetical protein
MSSMTVKTTYPKNWVNKDKRIFTLDHYYIALNWWIRDGHFNEALYRQIVSAKLNNRIHDCHT